MLRNKNISIFLFVLMFSITSITLSRVIDVNSDTVDLGTIYYHDFPEEIDIKTNKIILKIPNKTNIKIVKWIEEENSIFQFKWLNQYQDKYTIPVFIDKNDFFVKELGIKFNSQITPDDIINKDLYHKITLKYLEVNFIDTLEKTYIFRYMIEIPKDLQFEQIFYYTNCKNYLTEFQGLVLGNLYNFGNNQMIDSIKIKNIKTNKYYEPFINNYIFEQQKLPKLIETNRPVQLFVKDVNFEILQDLEITYHFTNPKNKIFKIRTFDYNLIDLEYNYLNISNYLSAQNVYFDRGDIGNFKIMLDYKNPEILTLDSVIFPKKFTDKVNVKLKDDQFPIILNDNCKIHEILFEFTSNNIGIYNDNIVKLYFTKNGEQVYREMYMECRVQLSNSVEIFDINNINIYPNPTSEKISLDLVDVEIADLVVYDILGNETMSIQNYTNKSEIDISSLPKGTYLIKIQHGNNTKSVKVVVN